MRVFLLGLLALTAAPAPAQPAPPPPPRPAGVAAPAQTPGAAFGLAVQMIAQGQAAQAVPLLEDLLAGQPDATPVQIKLQEAYEALGQTDRALALVERRAAGGGGAVARAERGAVLARAGRRDEAAAAWNAALAADPRDDAMRRAVAEAMGTARLYAEAAAVLDAGAEARRDPSLFRFERAHLYTLAADVDRAATLYLAAVADDPAAAGAVRARLVRLVGQPGAPERIAAAAARAAAQAPLNRGLRELGAWIAQERGDFEAALDAVRALDRLDREQGQSLVAFAEASAAAGAPDVATRALDEVLTRHPGSPVAPYARLARARLGVARSRLARERAPGPTSHALAARADFAVFAAEFPGFRESARAFLDAAALEAEVFLDAEAAERLRTQATRAAEATGDALALADARLALGDAAVLRGDLAAARERYQAVEETLRTGAQADEARFELALLDFYEGFVYSALARAEAISENTAADATNDAISLRVTLNENASADSVSAELKAYAAAALLVRQNRDADALAALDALFDPAHPLADEVLFLRAEPLRGLGRAEDAIASLERLATTTPDSFFRDRALVRTAEIAERDVGDRARAEATLRDLLRLFPGSLFAPQARADIERLRQPAPERPAG